MPLVSGMIPGDSRSAPSTKRKEKVDKTNAFAKRVVRGASLEQTGQVVAAVHGSAVFFACMLTAEGFAATLLPRLLIA